MAESNTGACVRCGVETDIQVQGTWICESCYIARSSCCPEFGPDDLATENDPDETNQEDHKNESGSTK